MRLSEILHAVYFSHPEDWEEVSRGGNGPLYRDSFITSMGSVSDRVQLDVVSHYGYAVLEPNADITIAWGIDPHATGSMQPDRSLTFDWAHFPDRAVSAFLADVFYRGALVHRVWTLHVDGGRLSVPMPERDHGGQYFTERSIAFGRIVDHLDGGGVRDFDAAINRTGLPIR